MSAVYLHALGWVCALGRGDAARDALFAGEPQGVRATELHTPGRALHLGCVELPVDALRGRAPRWHSRSNALLALAIEDVRFAVDALRERHGPARIAAVVGVSAAGLQEGEAAARLRRSDGRWPAGYDYAQQEMGNAAQFLAAELALAGPCYGVSTACSSSAKAIAAAARLLRAGAVDAVVAGGVDALSPFTIAGFSALESVSPERCNPLSVNRRGINIGEGAALFVVTRDSGPVRLAGWGESSDAHHMSAPDPAGRGAIAAMHRAIERAQVRPHAIDYVNLHGTATPQNDAMESLAVAQVLGLDVPVSSTKPLTGHTLGAAGAIEAAVAWHTLVNNPGGRLPPHWWDGERDAALPPVRVVRPGECARRAPKYVLSNSFAFGGSNATLLLAGE